MSKERMGVGREERKERNTEKVCFIVYKSYWSQNCSRKNYNNIIFHKPIIAPHYGSKDSSFTHYFLSLSFIYS